MPVIYFNKKKMVKFTAVAVCAALLIGMCFLIGSERKGAVREFATCDEIGRYFTEVSDIKSRVEFLKQFGIEIYKKSEKKDTITIPNTFNVTYKYYNKLQKDAGLDLEMFKGCEVERAVYKMKTGGNVTLLIYKGHVIAGHIESGIYGQTYRPLQVEG
ncbi:MAG: DUF4830 domain-containing protein [Ruminococcus sp.]|nr:DUF4830 domain-containing protein [Ruminococcus sp.]